jgi:uncharacterized protein (TIGR02145 family)
MYDTSGRFVFMDRNLGAKEAGQTYNADNAGLFYQWGRKDPFPNTGDPGDRQAVDMFTAEPTDVDKGTIEYTIQHPDVFLTHDFSSPYNWYLGIRGDELWGHNDVKSVYDPCPAGWRVPDGIVDKSPWAGFTKNNKADHLAPGGEWNAGYSWGDNAKYPATGIRDFTNGKLNGVADGVATTSFHWFAETREYQNQASYLILNKDNVIVGDNQVRGYGLSVRCVRE